MARPLSSRRTPGRSAGGNREFSFHQFLNKQLQEGPSCRAWRGLELPSFHRQS